MAIGTNSGYSQLFQGLSSSSGSGNSNFLADYASIKSGSYSRLMKAYYSTGQSISTGSTGTKNSTGGSGILEKILEERRNPKVSEEVQEANANLTSGISSLKTAVSALQNDNTYTSTQNGQSATDKTISAMKNFVSQYNDVVTAAKRSTLSNKTAYVANMMSSTAANADKLSEIGVSLNSDGTLRFTEGKVTADSLSKVQELFSSKDIMSYGSSITSRLQFASIASGADSTKKDDTTGSSAAALKADSEALASDKLYEKVKDKYGKETDQYDIDKILSTAKSFVSNYNSMFDAAESSSNSGVVSNLSQIREKTLKNADALKQFGISVDEKGRMKMDEDTFKKSDMSKVQSFFKDYGSSIATNASLVDYYMTTKANAASGYNAAGAYSVQGSSRYTDSI